ncbi:hypothetical protein [Microbispora hainanensis]
MLSRAVLSRAVLSRAVLSRAAPTGASTPLTAAGRRPAA